MFDTKQYEEKFEMALLHFEEEIKKIRTGRAHPGQLESIKVEVYGTMMPLNQVSNITAPEAQLLQITPFDPANMNAISTAIRNDQSMGFNPSDDGRVIRVPVPALTEERRHLIVKQAGEKVEDARISLRGTRQDAFKDAKQKKDSKDMSEDDLKRAEKSVDESIAKYNAKLDGLFRAKEKEILTL